MGFREERIAKNEAVVREINEKVEQSRHHISFMHMVCECGYDRCDDIIALTKDEYEEIRSDPRQFFVVQEHVIPDVEAIVEENDRFVIVAKREGTPAEIAIRTNPRS
jgi:5-bromo-4-chloroindolyl phosphate hydrolysis protein